MRTCQLQVHYRTRLADPTGVPLDAGALARCRVYGGSGDDCNLVQWVVMERTANVVSSAPGITAVCDASLPVPPIAIPLPFVDEFDMPAEWELTEDPLVQWFDPANWSFQNGVLAKIRNDLQINGLYRDLEGRGALAAVGDPAWTDIRVETTVIGSRATTVGVLARYTDPRNHFRFEVGEEDFGGGARIVSVVDGRYEVLAEDPDFVGFQIGAPGFELVLEVEGDRLRGYVDGAFIVQGRSSGLRAGRAGLYSAWNPTTISFERFEVRALGSP